LAIAPGGNLAILDNSLSRVVVLTQTGTLVDMVSLRVGGPLQLAFAQGKLWTSHSTPPGEDRPTLRSWSLDPLMAVDAISLTGIDRDFGGSGDLQVGPDGSLFRNLRIPGVWLKISAGGARRMGVQLVEDLEPPVVTRNSPTSIRIEQPRAWSDGIGVTPGGMVLQSYIELPSAPTPEQPLNTETRERWLAVFDSSGVFFAKTKLPAEVNSLRTVSASSGHLFFGVSEPFPQVVEYALTISRTS
jgi:hypothetical protein